MKLLNLLFSIAVSLLVMSPRTHSEEPKLTTDIGNFKFAVADGLSIERVVDESLIQWPIAATFAENGDLLVLECHWNRESVKKQLESKPHKIVRLSDTDRDGKFDLRTVVADELGFPEGIMVLDKDLLVTTPPQILRLSDKDGDGFFESRDVWFDGGTLTHCANDLHGPMMGPDGWVYWTKGAFDEQNHELISRPDRPDMQRIPSKASHIYRRHPKGGPIERLMTGGMDNPSDITFSPEGEIFFCSTFLHNPGNGLRDGIAHSPRGGLFGKRHHVIDGHWTTGPLLEPIANLGAAAPASLHYLQSNCVPSKTWFPNANDSNMVDRFLVSAQFNLQKIGLHRLIPDGASFKTETYDLLSADRIDFHPVDTLEEPDGSLLVFDTGGWYDLCCPSSGSDQSIARGGIYRLKATVPNRSGTSRQLEAGGRVKQLWKYAGNLTANPDSSRDKEAVIRMLRDSESSVQQTAARIVALMRWNDAKEPLVDLLKSSSASTVRTSIEALGVVGDAQTIVRILEAFRRFPNDRYIVHSTIFALIEIGAKDELIRVVAESTVDTDRFAATYALDQLKALPETLLPKLVASLGSEYLPLRELSIRCLASNEQGIAKCVEPLKSAWDQKDLKQLEAFLPIVHRGDSNAAIRSMINEWLSAANTLSREQQSWLLASIQGSGSQKIPESWGKRLIDWVVNARDDELGPLAKALQSIAFQEDKREELTNQLRARALKVLGQPELSLTLLAACPNVSKVLEDKLSDFVVEQIAAPESVFASQAERVLNRCSLDRTAAMRLIDVMEKVPPLYLQTALECVLRCNDGSVDDSLLKVLPTLPAIKTLSGDRVLASLGSRPESVKQTWMAMIRKATEPPADIAENIDSWLKRLPAGDAVRGYQVFRREKAACSKCHQVGYIGGNVGPELSRIGKSRSRRDLVEAIVFPSVRLEQGFYSTRIRTVDGDVINGILKSQTSKQVELLDSTGAIRRVDRSQIEELADSKLSVMPNGLEQQMSLDEFADLLAFLESKR